MDDGGTTQPAAKKRRTAVTPYMPHELVSEILARLPVESLLRFRCVCKAWRSTISGDASFHRTHLRLQRPCLLLSPKAWFVHHDDNAGPWRKVGLYRWEASQGTEAPLLHATFVSSTDTMHGLAHCDGLVLVATEPAAHSHYWARRPYEGTVRVLNPATRRILTLSRPRHRDPHHLLSSDFLAGSHQSSFGLGRDPRSNAYKVARFFYRSALVPATPTNLGKYSYTTGMEVFTIGADQQWRETAARPPYPPLTPQTATFCQGSLLWIIDQRALMEAAAPPCLLRFSLADETFGLVPLPPRRDAGSNFTGFTGFAELRGELCVVRVHTTVEMWMCADVDNPRWELRHEVVVPISTPHLYPIGEIDGHVVFRDKTRQLLRRFDLRTKTAKDPIGMRGLRYHNPRQDDGTSSEYPLVMASFDVIPYVQSLIPV